MIWNRYRLIKLMRVLWTADLCKLIKHFWANRSMDLYFLVIPYQQRVSPDWLHTTPNICALCLLNGCSLWKQAKCLCQKKASDMTRSLLFYWFLWAACVPAELLVIRHLQWDKISADNSSCTELFEWFWISPPLEDWTWQFCSRL